MRIIVIFAVLAIVALTIGLEQIEQRKDGITELYFSTHTELPKNISTTRLAVDYDTFTAEEIEDVLDSNATFPHTMSEGNRDYIYRKSNESGNTYLTIFEYPTEEIAFIIHNREYQPVEYTYRVDIITEESNRTITEGTVKLLDQEQEEVTFLLYSREEFGEAKIQIILEERKENIHFWVSEI